MDINDIEIKIKKYDREKNCVIANIIVSGELEIRGFVVRFTFTKHSLNTPVWIVSPPSVKGRNKFYFWVVRFKDSSLWQRLQERLIEEAKAYSNSI